MQSILVRFGFFDNLVLVVWVIKTLASGLGSGYVPYVTGTAGSLVGVLLFIVLSCCRVVPYFFLTAGLTLFAAWISHLALPLYNDPEKPGDPKQIVIDEVVGFLWAGGVLRWLGFWNPKEGLFWLLVFSFAFFRLFDVTKWWLVGWAEEKFKGAWGIVMDDVVAGILAGLTAILFCIVYPLVVYLLI